MKQILIILAAAALLISGCKPMEITLTYIPPHEEITGLDFRPFAEPKQLGPSNFIINIGVSPLCECLSVL